MPAASPCLIEPRPAGSKTDLPLAKAEPFSNTGSTSVITFNKGKNCCTTAARRGVRICERNNSADTEVGEEGGGGGPPGIGAEISLQPVVKTMVRQAVPLQPMEVNSGSDIYPAAHGRPHARAGGCVLKEAMTLWRAHTGAGSW
ncbi:protein pxr1-like [Limosa lapponica baueri]|uniref:Protein pxr1-like n=1 Tax=Limosa lapponica baueri TaxID=1758121 RepID=A0A2I0UM61_LIMLA|nr:protein pxr1-like [Limosa lapponica baueri]